MKRFIQFTLLLFLAVPVFAGEVALVYKDKKAVREGKYWLAVATPEGILITAEQALESKTKPIAGFLNGQLKWTSLIRLDNDMDVALMKMGTNVADKKVTDQHKTNVKALELFLPKAKDGAGYFGANTDKDLPDLAISTEPFAFKIDGVQVLDAPIEIKVNKRKVGTCRFEVVNLSTHSLWYVELKLESEPDIFFWKKGKQKTLNDVPKKKFVYNRQISFRAMKRLRSFVVPLELSYVKNEACVWTVDVKTKHGSFTKDIPIKFLLYKK